MTGDLTVSNIILNGENFNTELTGYFLSTGGYISGAVDIQADDLTLTGRTLIYTVMQSLINGTVTVDGTAVNPNSYVNITGGTMTGNLTVPNIILNGGNFNTNEADRAIIY